MHTASIKRKYIKEKMAFLVDPISYTNLRKKLNTNMHCVLKLKVHSNYSKHAYL